MGNFEDEDYDEHEADSKRAPFAGRLFSGGSGSSFKFPDNPKDHPYKYQHGAELTDQSDPADAGPISQIHHQQWHNQEKGAHDR